MNDVDIEKMTGIGPEVVRFSPFPYHAPDVKYFVPALDGKFLWMHFVCYKCGKDYPLMVYCPYQSLVEDWLLEAVVSLPPHQFWDAATSRDRLQPASAERREESK